MIFKVLIIIYSCSSCSHSEVERVVIVGVSKPSKVSLTAGKDKTDLDFEYPFYFFLSFIFFVHNVHFICIF